MIFYKAVFRPGTIMRRAFHIGIVLAMTAHMLCGCCLHHAHACFSQGEALQAVDVAGHSDHEGHSPEGVPDGHGDKRGRCDEGSCRFIRVDSSGSSDFSTSLACLPLTLCLPPLPELSGIDATDLAPSYFGTSVSLLLLNQAFLL